jgi:predicted metal-dependent hydrolase
MTPQLQTISELDGSAMPWPPEYERFVALFNAGHFFEAHEVLEDLWVIEVPPLKNYYKGLIQAAVAICHWERGNLNGARKLWISAETYLIEYPQLYEGLTLGSFREAMRCLFAPLMRLPEAPSKPDRKLIPVLELNGGSASV